MSRFLSGANPSIVGASRPQPPRPQERDAPNFETRGDHELCCLPRLRRKHPGHCQAVAARSHRSRPDRGQHPSLLPVRRPQMGRRPHVPTIGASDLLWQASPPPFHEILGLQGAADPGLPSSALRAPTVSYTQSLCPRKNQGPAPPTQARSCLRKADRDLCPRRKPEPPPTALYPPDGRKSRVVKDNGSNFLETMAPIHRTF